VVPHGWVASHPLTLFLPSSSQNFSFSQIVSGCRGRYGGMLMMGSLPSSCVVSPQRTLVLVICRYPEKWLDAIGRDCTYISIGNMSISWVVTRSVWKLLYTSTRILALATYQFVWSFLKIIRSLSFPSFTSIDSIVMLYQINYYDSSLNLRRIHHQSCNEIYLLLPNNRHTTVCCAVNMTVFAIGNVASPNRSLFHKLLTPSVGGYN